MEKYHHDFQFTAIPGPMVLSDSGERRISVFGVQKAGLAFCIASRDTARVTHPRCERVTRDRERERTEQGGLLRGRGCHGRTRRVFRELPAVYNGALVPPAPSCILLCHCTAVRAHTLARAAFSRARDRSLSSYLTALVRPAGRPAKLRKPVLLKKTGTAGSSAEHARERPRRALLRNIRR